MAEKEGIDIDDSTESELAPLEEVDLSDEMEIVPDEEETDETLVIPQEEVAIEIAESESIPPDSDTISEVDELPNPGDTELEVSSIETESINPLEAADEDKDGQLEPDELDSDDFLGLDDEEFDDEPLEKQDPSQEETVLKNPENNQSENISELDDEPTENLENNIDNDRDSAKSAKRSKSKITLKKPSQIQIIIALIFVLMLSAGGVLYLKPAFLRFDEETNSAATQTITPSPSVPTVSKQESPAVSSIKKEQAAPAISLSKNEVYLLKIKDAGRLIDELLSKKEEIYLLKLHYQNGIADLEEQINQELRKEGITSLKNALSQRRIELSLRTIQRRRSYMKELEKPIRWIKQGTEELLYLKRKAEFDLQLVDIAGGIDMDRHMRYIDAAIQKFRPSAAKLAVDRENTKLASLEIIWRQLRKGKKKTRISQPNSTDKKITNEICSGNYERTADLANMSIETAKCLSKMNGPDLFLNSVTTLSPGAAKSLFQWRGSWVCLNGIQKLSPAAAKYLFKWDGNWISLNGLIEFPPELATFLMEWEGNQLELMGLRYNKKNADKKALKYLALWETMGGKLFISDDVRKEIERVLM
jgi:hypothetical protein